MSALAPATVLGIGAVTPVGRDLNTIRQILSSFSGRPEGAPNCAPSGRPPNENIGILRVPEDMLTDPSTAAQLRRADRFTRMAFLAATDAWKAAKQSCINITPERIGLIISSGFGPHCRGFRFLDGILDAGDTAASPTDFSHSVHGAASAYISRLLDLRGPALNITDFEIGFEETVRIAQCWLDEKACDRVLIGAVEELGDVMLSCASRMLEGRADIVPAEGAVFLMLGPPDVAGIARLDAVAAPAAVDLLIVEDPTILKPQAIPSNIFAQRTISFTNMFGHSASSTAFSLLGALLSLDSIDTAATLRTLSDGLAITLLLEK